MSAAPRSGAARLGEARRLARRLGRYVRKDRRSLALAALLTIGFLACEVAQPWPIKVVIDQVIIGAPWAVLPPWLAGDGNRMRLLGVACGGLLALALLGGALGHARAILIARVGQAVVARIRADLHDRLLRLSLAYHGRERSGDLLVRLTGDVAMMKVLLVEGVFGIAQEAFLALATLAIMFAVDWRLALVALLIVPGVAALLVRYGGRIRNAARRQRKKEGVIAAAIGESLAAVPVIQAYSLESEAHARFRAQNRKSLRAGLAAARLESAMSRATEAALAAAVAAILLAGTVRAVKGHLTAGELLVFVSYVRALHRPVRRIVAGAGRIAKSAACAERILEVLEAPDDLVSPPGAQTIERARGEVAFEGVAFAHEPGRNVLEGIDLVVPAGRRLAIVGENGSGKSTLLSLVPRLRDPSAGTVRLDGIDVRELDLAALRRQIAVVFQGGALFDGTIRENVLLGRPGASEEEVRRAAERAGVLRFAAALPSGLETKVGEGGGALSGGERQRIALARALLRDAPVVLLDEPTASLDPETAAQVTSEILERLEGKTVILVTHRLEGLERADEVVVLERGRIVARGPFEALAERGGALARLARASAGSGA